MNIIENNKNDDPSDIYFYRPNQLKIETNRLFQISIEGDKLRVKNDNVNCLFSTLTFESFDKYYNEFVQHLNLNFDPITLNGRTHSLSDKEQRRLTEKIITAWMYFYSVNNLNIEVKRSDFMHPYMVDYVLNIIDGKFGVDTEVSLHLGAKILRQPIEEYKGTVHHRRIYYDR